MVDESIQTERTEVGEDESVYDISKIDFERLRKEFEKSPAKKTTVQNLREAIENRLRRLLQMNPLRTDFQKHYEEIVNEYNREKDRLTIEKTFEALMVFMGDMSDEEQRSVKEGLNEESLALFDLLLKPNLSKAEIARIKRVAVELLKTLKAEKLKVDHWRDKEATRDAVKIAIGDYLYSDDTGLPVESYTDEEVSAKAEEVFKHVFRVYPTIPSPFYSETECA